MGMILRLSGDSYMSHVTLSPINDTVTTPLLCPLDVAV